MNYNRQTTSFIIIGLGKVGSAIGYCLQKAGYLILAVVDPSRDAREQHIALTGGQPFAHISEIDIEADCYLITTGDDQIATACEMLSPKLRPESIVIHMSGASSLNLLEAAKAKGALTGSIHPLQTFSDPQNAIRVLPGTVYGITVDPALKVWAEQLIQNIGGHPFFIAEQHRPLYHAAACVVSNYFVSLMYMAEEMYGMLGLTAEQAREAFWPLLMGTLHNIENKGSVASLTGPIARGDAGTVAKHLQVIQTDMPNLLSVYQALGNITVEVALRKKTLSEKDAEIIKSLLAKGA